MRGAQGRRDDGPWLGVISSFSFSFFSASKHTGWMDGRMELYPWDRLCLLPLPNGSLAGFGWFVLGSGDRGGLVLFLEGGCGLKGFSRAINAVFASSIASVGKRYLALVYGCLFFLCCGLMERGWGGGACLLRTLEMGFSLRRLGQR